MSENRFDENYEYRDKKERIDGPTTEEEYLEETAAEVSPNGVLDRPFLQNPENERPTAEEKADTIEDGVGADTEVNEGRGTGFIALVLSVISVFILPVIFGAAGIIVGFIARRRGAKSLGSWAIGIGAASLIISLFFSPFF
ncbi:DUF308 domain-containing protein [Pseudalkalibacillus caeni]|uniref:DUF308 domain-containing protein n=1 Tax=Exobacillus caeni TaxID=2574798 RepID=A0A5R9EZS1_9BACL|nr:DUF308 domain-containing protein [Pseudalkalibacillus caeni]TLS36291.1 DUF308 domain-containing protein [Pseudalkalibacillus caeni]